MISGEGGLLMVRRGMAAALCAAALVLAGCSDDPPKPKPLDPPSGSETTTAPPTSEPPKAQTPEQAIREWIQASHDAQESGDTTAFRMLGRECTPCEKFADNVDSIYEAGGWVKPPRQTIKSIKMGDALADGHRFYQAKTFSRAWSLKESRTASVTKQPGGDGTLKVEVRRFNDRWLVVNYTVLISPGAA